MGRHLLHLSWFEPKRREALSDEVVTRLLHRAMNHRAYVKYLRRSSLDSCLDSAHCLYVLETLSAWDGRTPKPREASR